MRNFTIFSILCLCLCLAYPKRGSAQSAMDAARLLGEYKQALLTYDPANLIRFYSSQTLTVMQDKKITGYDMGLEYYRLGICGDPDLKLNHGFGVLLFYAEDKRCHPYFMVFQKGLWRYDFVSMSQVLQYNELAHVWTIDKMLKTPYSFAFETAADRYRKKYERKDE